VRDARSRLCKRLQGEARSVGSMVGDLEFPFLGI